MSSAALEEERKVNPAAPRSLADRARRFIYPAREKLRARGFLTKSRAFLEDSGLNRVSALMIDDRVLFPPSGREEGSLSSAVQSGLAYLEDREPVRQVVLVAQGRSRGFMITLTMHLARRHARDQPALLVNVSALPTEMPEVGRPPKDANRIEWLAGIVKKQADRIRAERQALVDTYTERLSAAFPSLRIRVTKKT
jgi:hypothetical protein